MDPDLGVGPVVHRLPAQEVRVLHIRKSILDLRLTTVRQHNLFVAPRMLVGEENAFAQLLLLDPCIGGSIGPVGELQ
jgi:hypothetical protein